jgi:hypothetical protein
MTLEERPCAHCISPRIAQARRTAFTVVSRCRQCGRLFTHPLSVVLVDPQTARREQMVSSLRAERIRVIAASRIANLERWPVVQVVVTHDAHATRSWFNVGATHVIVLADTDEEQTLARRSGASAVVASRNCAALLSILRSVAELPSDADSLTTDASSPTV